MRRVAARLHDALPPPKIAFFGTAVWAAVMAASATVIVWGYGWQTPAKLLTIALIYALGAAIAFPIGLYLARLVSLGRSFETAFAAMFLALAGSTVGLTAGIYALGYRQYYATWHENFLTVTWTFQLVFTTAVALVQFLVLGLPLFFPIGFVALLLASLGFARSSR